MRPTAILLGAMLGAMAAKAAPPMIGSGDKPDEFFSRAGDWHVAWNIAHTHKSRRNAG
jgi:hypothetical protein